MSGASTPIRHADPAAAVVLGLRANWRQFWLLVLVNAFVGAMVGMERTVLPLLAQAEFGLASKSAVLSFIATFGVVKALTNFFAGRLGDTAVVPRLVERLYDRDPAVRREAIRALGELRAVEAVLDIADAIEGLKEWSNLLLLMALIRMGPACAPSIGALLAEPDARSPAMLKGLLQVTSRIGVATDPDVVRSLASHEDMEVRVEAVRVLGAITPDPRSGDVCLAAIDDAEWPVRAIAASSLGRLRDERALARLRQAMGDPAYWVRHHVAEAMASMEEPGAEALRDALRDANPFVRDMAAQTLFMRTLAEGEAA